MAKTILIFSTLVLFLSIRVFSQSNDDFIFHGFRNAGTSITLNGAARIQRSGILKLTNFTPSLVGHGFYETPFRFKNGNSSISFSTTFAFAIVPEYEKLGGHGFAFTVSKSKGFIGALPRQYLGLLNESNFGNFSNHVFAVEFDTVRDYSFEDIDDNHVGIDFNSLISNVSVTAGNYAEDGSGKQPLNLKSGKLIQAWIDYDSVRKELNVTLSLSSSKPKSPILSIHVDLSLILMEYMYVGFSASTGLLASSHYISGWSFKMNGQTQTLDLSSCPSIPGQKQNLIPLALGTSFVSAAFFMLGVGIAVNIVKKIKNRDVVEPWEIHVGPHRFSYKELKKATRSFSNEELIGFGGFGRVYKGTMPDSNTQVAVKQISHESKQGLREFLTEIESIGRLRHRNLVPLQGWCRKRGDLLLVYDFMPNGSLDKYIFDEPKIILSWEQRFKIIKGVASGLLYLHEEWEQTVIHRDIKAGNVLLDSEMNGRLGDFGLAKLYDRGSSPTTTKVVGTLGYLAPELTKTGKPTVRSDVFAFGALLLEVVCGRRPVEAKAVLEEMVLVDWVWDKWRERCVLKVVDPRLNVVYNEIEVEVVIKLGLLCSDNDPSRRPSMRQVVRVLEGELTLPETLVSLDECDGEKIVNFVGSYQLSSNYDKASMWLLACDGVDLQTGSTSPVSVRTCESELR